MAGVLLEPAREVRVIPRCEGACRGGRADSGGLSAALAEARVGVDLCLLERFGCHGGDITVVGVEGFDWYRHEQK